MPRIKMLKSEHGADAHEDGRTHGLKFYEKDSEFEVGEALARAFESTKSCKRIEAATPSGDAGDAGAGAGAGANAGGSDASDGSQNSKKKGGKAKGAAPENKSAEGEKKE